MSAAVPAGYKLTEVGVIPGDWNVCRLDSLGGGSIPAIKAGPFGSSLTKDTYVAAGFKVYGQEQVIRGDYLYGDYFISAIKYRELETCAVNPGDVLLSLVGTTGKLLVVPEAAPAGVINPRLIRFSFDKKKVCPRFFKELFESVPVQSFLARYAQGGTMGVLNAGMLRPFTISLPPLPEQRAIATALLDVDALLVKLDALVAKKCDLKQAAMQQLLTGQTRLPGFGGEWEVKRLGDVAHIKTGVKNNDDKVEDGEYPLFVRSQTVERIDSYSYDCEAILVPGEGGIGSIFHYINGRFDCHQRVYKISAFNVNTCGKFVFFCMKHFFHIQASRHSVKATVDSLRLPTFLEFEFVAPGLKEQEATVETLDDMDAELTALETRRDKARALKQGMMQELLTGRIRLV